MPPTYSPFAMLHIASISLRGAFTRVWCLGFCCRPARNTPWPPGSGSQRGLQSWVSQDCHNWRQFLTLPGHGTDSRLKHTPVFWWKRTICLSWSFGLRESLLVWYTTKGQWEVEVGVHNLWALPLSRSSFPASPRKELIFLYGTLIFVASSGDTSALPGCGGQWGFWNSKNKAFRGDEMMWGFFGS